MPIDLTIPSVGESITEVQIGEWLKSEGDTVKQDEPLAVIDSEKTTFELPAPRDGKLTKILKPAGETVPVGAVVAQMESDGETGKSEPAAAPKKGESPATGKPSGGKNETVSELKQPPKQSPPVAKQASLPPTTSRTKSKKPGEDAQDPTKVTQQAADEASPDDSEADNGAASSNLASSPTKTEAAQPASRQSPASAEGTEQPSVEPKAAASSEDEVVPMTMLRRTAARRLVEAQNNMAMLTTFNEADMSAIQQLRKEYQEEFEKRHRVKLGFMSFFIKAAVDALRQFRQLNAEIRGNDIIYHKNFDVGVAVATERGLVVPVLRHVEQMSFADIEKAVGDFASRAREGLLKPAELDGGTFTITNGGVFGSLLSTPIINPPQTGILGLHSIQERPVAVQGQVVIRPMMYLALTYDHRLVDGREAVLFLRRVKQSIEAPARMLIEV